MTKPREPAENTGEVRVVGMPRVQLRTVYHAFLVASWWAALLGIVAAYLSLNACFALAYWLSGGIAEARPGSFADAFYFSIQTMGTIGYGTMHPASPAANVLVVLESVTGLIVTALATGLVFAKFSRSTARIAFARQAVIAPMDGVPTLMVRVGNQRGNHIIDAHVRIALVRTERTKEGVTFYRLLDLALSRDRAPALSRSWTALHPITPGSPLHGQSPESIKAAEVELIVTIIGLDDTSLQPVHSRHRYLDGSILWGARYADILYEAPDGALVLDVRRFHDTVPTEPTEEFPYPTA